MALDARVANRPAVASIFLGWAILLVVLNPTPCFATHDKWFDYKQQGEREEIGRNFKDAEQLYRKAFQESWSLGASSNEMAESLIRLATVLVVQRKFDQAEPYYQRLMKLAAEKKKNNTLSEDNLTWLEDLAEDYQQSSNGPYAVAGLQHALALRDLMNGDKAPYMEINLRLLVTTLMTENRIREAEPYALRLVKIEQKKKKSLRLITATDIYVLGQIEHRLVKNTEAESYTRQALTMFGSCEIPPGQATTNCLIQLANVLKFKKDYVHAAEAAKRAIQISKRTNGKNSIGTVPARQTYADMLLLGKKYAESIRQNEEIISILQAKQGPTDVRLRGIVEHYKEACTKANQPAKARAADKLLASVNAKMKKEQMAGHH